MIPHFILNLYLPTHSQLDMVENLEILKSRTAMINLRYCKTKINAMKENILRDTPHASRL